MIIRAEYSALFRHVAAGIVLQLPGSPGSRFARRAGFPAQGSFSPAPSHELTVAYGCPVYIDQTLKRDLLHTQRTQRSLRVYPLSRLRASVVFTNFPIFRQCRHPYGTRQKTAEASLKRSAEDCKSGTYLKISRSDADCTPHAPKRWADVFGQIAGSQKILMMVFAYEVPVSPNNSRLVFRYENV